MPRVGTHGLSPSGHHGVRGPGRKDCKPPPSPPHNAAAYTTNPISLFCCAGSTPNRVSRNTLLGLLGLGAQTPTLSLSPQDKDKVLALLRDPGPGQVSMAKMKSQGCYQACLV